MNSLAQHSELFRPHSQLGDIDKKWCILFIDYLKHKALNLNFQRSKDPNKRKEVLIGQNSQNRLIATLNNALNTAVRESLIAHNPMNELNAKEKVPAKKGKTNKWLSEQVGKDPATVSKWCTNAAQPTLETMMLIAKILEVDLNDLVRFEALSGIEGK